MATPIREVTSNDKIFMGKGAGNGYFLSINTDTCIVNRYIVAFLTLPYCR